MSDLTAAITLVGQIQETGQLSCGTLTDHAQLYEGTIHSGFEMLNMYEIAVNNGYEGTFNEWCHDMSLAWIDVFDFYIDPDTGYLMGSFDISKYDFSINEDGNMEITEKGGN